MINWYPRISNIKNLTKLTGKFRSLTETFFNILGQTILHILRIHRETIHPKKTNPTHQGWSGQSPANMISLSRTICVFFGGECVVPELYTILSKTVNQIKF